MPNRNSEKFETIVIDNTVKSLNPPAGRGSDEVLITCEEAAVRWRDDGTDPVAGFGGGHLLPVGVGLNYDGDENKIKFTRDGGVSGRINVSYYS